MPENVNRPTRDSSEEEIFYYIEYLEDKLAQLNRNGAVALAAAMNKKFIQLANTIDQADLGYGDAKDKKFDRFIQLAKISAELIKNFKTFIHDYGDEIEQEDKKSENIMESFAKKKR